MTNSLTRMPDPASQWFWNGSQWVCGCDPDDGTGQPPVVIQPPVPPPFFPPPITQPPWYPGANGGVSFGVTAPPNPIRGAFWWDGLVLWLFDGAAWVNTATGVTQGGGSGGTPGGGSGAGTVVISSTAPGNPVTGMQWWDGTVLRVYDGTQWNIVGPGATSGPVPTTTQTFRIAQPTDLSLAVNNWVIVPFTSTPQVDTTLGFDTVSKKFTPKKAGVYQFELRAYISVGGGGIALLKNDVGSFSNTATDQVLTLSTMWNSPGAGWVQASGNTVMNGTTDFVRMFCWDTDLTFHGIGQNPVFDAWILP